jgi:hypothetical protein
MQRRPQELINIDEVLKYLNQDRYMSKIEAAEYFVFVLPNLGS